MGGGVSVEAEEEDEALDSCLEGGAVRGFGFLGAFVVVVGVVASVTLLAGRLVGGGMALNPLA